MEPVQPRLNRTLTSAGTDIHGNPVFRYSDVIPYLKGHADDMWRHIRPGTSSAAGYEQQHITSYELDLLQTRYGRIAESAHEMKKQMQPPQQNQVAPPQMTFFVVNNQQQPQVQQSPETQHFGSAGMPYPSSAQMQPPQTPMHYGGGFGAAPDYPSGQGSYPQLMSAGSSVVPYQSAPSYQSLPMGGYRPDMAMDEWIRSCYHAHSDSNKSLSVKQIGLMYTDLCKIHFACQGLPEVSGRFYQEVGAMLQSITRTPNGRGFLKQLIQILAQHAKYFTLPELMESIISAMVGMKMWSVGVLGRKHGLQLSIFVCHYAKSTRGVRNLWTLLHPVLQQADTWVNLSTRSIIFNRVPDGVTAQGFSLSQSKLPDGTATSNWFIRGLLAEQNVDLEIRTLVKLGTMDCETVNNLVKLNKLPKTLCEKYMGPTHHDTLTAFLRDCDSEDTMYNNFYLTNIETDDKSVKQFLEYYISEGNDPRTTMAAQPIISENGSNNEMALVLHNPAAAGLAPSPYFMSAGTYRMMKESTIPEDGFHSVKTKVVEDEGDDGSPRNRKKRETGVFTATGDNPLASVFANILGAAGAAATPGVFGSGAHNPAVDPAADRTKRAEEFRVRMHERRQKTRLRRLRRRGFRCGDGSDCENHDCRIHAHDTDCSTCNESDGDDSGDEAKPKKKPSKY
jgi:hypothetical protein